MVPADKRIELIFNEIRVRTDETGACLDDENIKVYQATADNPKSQLLKTACGMEAANVRTVTNLMTVEFTRLI